MSPTISILITALLALIVGGALGYTIFRYFLNKKYKSILDDAAKEAEVMKKNKLLEVKEKFLNKKAELEKEVSQRNHKLQQAENHIKQREMHVNQRNEELQRRKAEIEKYKENVDNQLAAIERKKEELDKEAPYYQNLDDMMVKVVSNKNEEISSEVIVLNESEGEA